MTNELKEALVELAKFPAKELDEAIYDLEVLTGLPLSVEELEFVRSRIHSRHLHKRKVIQEAIERAEYRAANPDNEQPSTDNWSEAI